MGAYGLGVNHKVNLLVNEEGAAIIEQLGLTYNRIQPTG